MDYYTVCSALEPLRGRIRVSTGSGIMSMETVQCLCTGPWKSKPGGFVQKLQFGALVGLVRISALYLSNAASLKRMTLKPETKSHLPGGANPRQSFVYAVLYQ